MELNAILNLLSDGEFHSGAELGDILGVSRTAVWKHLQKLEPLGLSLVSVKGKGYCLEGGLELLDRERILETMGKEASRLVSDLDIHFVTDSTNVKALSKIEEAKAQEGDTRGYVCLAEQQTAGKGRRGRSWISPFGKNIYLSVVWGFDGGVAALEGLSLAVGVAIVSALERCGLQGVQLKWPNDVLWQQKKLAGILLEMSGDLDGYCQVVVGIGLNVDMPGEAGDMIDQDWVDVNSIVDSQGASRVSRNQLASIVLSELLPMLQNYPSGGFAVHRPRWEVLDAYQGYEIEMSTASQVIRGTAKGVSDTGALIMEVDGVERHLSGGEISLRATGSR